MTSLLCCYISQSDPISERHSFRHCFCATDFPVPYTWKTTSFIPPDKSNLVIYELLVRDFTANHDYKTLIDTLGYLVNLGINAIELMPINEFEGNISWGYNPSFYFAPDKYYGPKNDLKHLLTFVTAGA